MTPSVSGVCKAILGTVLALGLWFGCAHPGDAQVVEDLHVDFPGGFVEERTSYTELAPSGGASVSIHIYGEPSDANFSDFEAEWTALMEGLHRFDGDSWSFERAALELRLLEYRDYSLDELMVLVGVAWGFNVTEEGIVHLTGGDTFDLAEVAA